MKKLSAVLVLLALLLSSADAGQMQAIIEPNQGLSADQESQPTRVMLGLFQSFGVNFTAKNASAAHTSFVRSGVDYPGGPNSGSAAVPYDAFAIVNSRVTWNSWTPGWNEDSLTRSFFWPSKPVIWFATTGAPGNIWGDASTDSTGIRNNVPISTGAQRWYNQYLVGQPEVWKASGVVLNAHSGAAPPGIWRPVVALGVSASNHAGALPLATAACTDCDSMGRFTTPDTVSLWARYRDPSDRAPLIFCEWSPSVPDVWLAAMALAMADSASGGQLITKQVKVAFLVDGIDRSGDYSTFDGIGDTLTAGIFARPDSSDFANVSATLDSMNTLRDWQGNQVPITFSVNADSLGSPVPANPTRSQLIRRVQNFRVALSSYTGVYLQPDVRQSSQYKLMDIFGHHRFRWAMPTTSTLPFTCENSDTLSVYCLLKRAFARADSSFGGVDRVSRVITPVVSDWTPTTVRRNNLQSLDSLLWAFGDLDVIGVVTSGYANENQIGRSRLATALGPQGYVANDIELVCRRPGVDAIQNGRLAILTTRGSDDMTAKLSWIQDAGHDITSEAGQGIFTGDWYRFHQTWHPNHMFESRTNIIRVNAPALGGAGQGTYAPRHAWWLYKWINNRINAINKLAGRTVIMVTTLDDIAASQGGTP